MGFCTQKQYVNFLQTCPEFERMVISSGTQLVKYWFSVSAIQNSQFTFLFCFECIFDWSNTFGGSQNDNGLSVISTNDAGFAITGMTRSLGDSNGDVWLIKVNSNGEIEWERTYGGDDTEYGRTIQQTVDLM